MNSDWFDERGYVRKDLNIHDKSIPCVIRLGYLYSFGPPCDGCIYNGCCRKNATVENQQAIKNLYPKIFDGTIQTREQYEKYIKGW